MTAKPRGCTGFFKNTNLAPATMAKKSKKTAAEKKSIKPTDMSAAATQKNARFARGAWPSMLSMPRQKKRDPQLYDPASPCPNVKFNKIKRMIEMGSAKNGAAAVLT